MEAVGQKGGSKSGFALVVVAFLISVMLLVGGAMVSLMQVESTATQYEMRMRMARDNARYALNVALGELQMTAGRDETVTAIADGYRTDSGEDFKDDADPDLMGVYEPFWTGVWDNSTATASDPIWLVTRPANSDSDFNGAVSGVEADPLVPQYDPSVALIRDRTATALLGTDQGQFEVTVPLEEIRTAGVLGKGSDSTIGRYGYWVGDLGVKASYSLLDRSQSVRYDDFASNENNGNRDRLNQLGGTVYPFKDFGTDLGIDSKIEWDEVEGSEEPLPLWIDLVSELQNREEQTAFSMLLTGLNPEGYRDYFHDFTWKSRSVLSDTLQGGLKQDLGGSWKGELFGDSLVDDYISPYLNSLGKIVDTPSAYERTYDICGDDPDTAARETVIGPIVVGFSVNFGFTIDRGTGGSNRPVLNVRFGIELYNPYSAALKMETLNIKMSDLPKMSLGYESGGAETDLYPLDLNEIMEGTLISLNATDDDDVLDPGRVRSYVGGNSMSVGVGTLDSDDFPAALTVTINNPESSGGYTNIPDFVDLTDTTTDDDNTLRGAVETVTPRIQLLDSSEHLLYDFQPVVGDTEWFESLLRETDGLRWDVSEPRFGYTWELLGPVGNESEWFGYDPRAGVVPKSLVKDVGAGDPLSTSNRAATLIAKSTANSGFFAHNAAEDHDYDYTFFELPRQGLHSISSVSDALVLSGKRWHLGSEGTADSINRLFDAYYFSTVPTSAGTGWSLDSPLPNSRFESIGPMSVAEWQAGGLSSKVWLTGALNINSTSIDAWALALRSIQLGSWNTVAGAQSFPSADYQFFRFSQSSENVWSGLHEDGDSSDTTLTKSFRSPVFDLSQTQIDLLAVEIVRRIRARIKSISGPFTSLADFVDSGILNEAIGAVAGLREAGVESFAPGYFDQIAILNAIGAYIVPRSDTFLVRAYGNVVDPYDSSELWAEAYCEAVVQRFPEEHSVKDELGAAIYGRKFKIVDFRWIGPGDL